MNLISYLSLRNRFMLAPLVGVILTLILYFSSHSIIQSHSNTLKQLDESNLPQISKLSRFTVLLSDNQIQLTNILIDAFESLDEEQVYMQGKAVVNQLHDIENEFHSIFNIADNNNTGKLKLFEQVEQKFDNYRQAVISAIELSTVDVKLAKRELKRANEVRHSLNTDLLVLTERHTKNLATSSKLISDSMYDDNTLLTLTIFLIFLMVSSSFLFANHLASNLDRIHQTLLNLSKGTTKFKLPEQKDKYLKKITLAVYKFRDSLQKNEKQQLALEHAFEKISDNEQRYFGMLKLIPTGIVAVDINQNIVLFNKAAESIFGYQLDEIIGQPVSKLIPAKYHGKHEQYVKDFESTDMGYEAMQKRGSVRGVKKNGEEVELEARIANLVLSKENLMVVAITDVTNRNITEQALRRAQKMDAIGQLCGGIAHDFNNLINVILGNLELLDKQLDDNDKVKKRTSTIRKSTQRAAELTSKLLGFSRHQVTEFKATNINTLINDMKEFISRSLTPKIELRFQLEKNLKKVNIDNGDFEDALINLVLNARDAMPDGGKLSIDTKNVVLDENYCAQHHGVTPGDYVQLIISDNGQGIPSKNIEHVFEPFYTTKEIGKGTGLGLAMVFGFVSRSNASINISSEENIGTTFYIYFPQTEHEVKSQLTNDQTPPPSLSPQGNETILVVDDEEDLLKLAQDILQELGYRVLTACDGQQALEILDREKNIDILFSDVVMPGEINGYQLANTAVRNNPQLKVLLTSGYTDKALDNKQQAMFNTKVLAKPYDLSVLAEQIRNTLDA